ncbi:MAG: alanine:cation symporter family protein, partial [Gammaproteobacteria bacterium]|nr:alanine:cation symporter family protein [Gammaproteobacteria bacterium]
LWCVLAFIGSIYGVKLIWDISDILIGLMVFPNVIGLLVLRRKVRETELMGRPEDLSLRH